jgi:hypothetical protein
MTTKNNLGSKMVYIINDVLAHVDDETHPVPEDLKLATLSLLGDLAGAPSDAILWPWLKDNDVIVEEADGTHALTSRATVRIGKIER